MLGLREAVVVRRPAERSLPWVISRALAELGKPAGPRLKPQGRCCARLSKQFTGWFNQKKPLTPFFP